MLFHIYHVEDFLYVTYFVHCESFKKVRKWEEWGRFPPSLNWVPIFNQIQLSFPPCLSCYKSNPDPGDMLPSDKIKETKKKWSALCIYICLLLRSTYHECRIVTCPYFGLRVSFLRAMPSFYKIHHPRHRAKVSQNDSHNMLRKQ